MMPELYPIEIKQGSDYNLTLTLLDDSDQAITLTNYTFDAQIREIHESNQKIDFTVTTIPSTGKVSLFLAAFHIAKPFQIIDQTISMISPAIYTGFSVNTV